MRKLITIILILICSKSFAQVYQLMPQYGYQAPRMAFDSTIQIPTFCGVPTLKSVQFATKKAAIAFDSCNNRFYQYNPKTQAWSQVSGGGGSETDTTSLSNRINLKLNISDTAAMLNSYLKKIDTATLSNRINLKIDSLKRRTDSVFAYRNGTEVFQFKDSVGGGGGSFLPLSGGTLTGNLTGTTATFSSNGSSNTFNINHTSGSGHSLEITKAGNGEGLIVNKTSGSGNAVTITGTLNATTIVKNGGTSSQFLKADGSVDATNYLIDTTLLQQKSLPAYSIPGNATYQTANAQSIYFKDTSGTYTGSPNWTGVAPTSGTFTYRWTRIGNLVTLNITLVYAVLGTALTGVSIPLPTDCPSPAIPSGLSSALNLLYPAIFVAQQTATGLPLGNAPRAYLRNNSGNNGFEIMCSFVSSSILQATVTTQYTAQ